MSLEGIVSKRLGSIYRSGRSKDWLKPGAVSSYENDRPGRLQGLGANALPAARGRLDSIGAMGLSSLLDGFEPLLGTSGPSLEALCFCLKLRDPILGGTQLQ
jgi:hypothetical protein